MKNLLTALCIVALCGCAMNRPVFRTETRMKDGTVEIKELKISTYALWPATTDLAKQKASIGKTMTLGTEGLHEDGGGTNMVEALRALDSILGKIRPTP